MVIPVGEQYDQNLLLITKDESGQVNREIIDKVTFIELVGNYGWHGGNTRKILLLAVKAIKLSS